LSPPERGVFCAKVRPVMGSRRIIYRWLFVFALLFVQTGGLAHGIAHTLSEKSQDQSQLHEHLCELCAAYAQLGSTLKSAQFDFTPVVQTSFLTATVFTSVGYSVFAAFAARAPPLAS